MASTTRELGLRQVRNLTGWLAAGSLAAAVFFGVAAASSHPAKTVKSSLGNSSLGNGNGSGLGTTGGDGEGGDDGSGSTGATGASGGTGAGVSLPSSSAGSPVASSGAS